MKRLFILRHAQTVPSDMQGDRARQLTEKGRADAKKLGQTMRAKNYVPDFIFCSPATRTKQTLEQVLDALGDIPTTFEKIIYEGGYPELAKLVQSADDSQKSLLVVGHNPAIHQFAASMAQEDGSALLNQLVSGYQPGTLSVFDVPFGNWKDLSTGKNIPIDLITFP